MATVQLSKSTSETMRADMSLRAFQLQKQRNMRLSQEPIKGVNVDLTSREKVLAEKQKDHDALQIMRGKASADASWNSTKDVAQNPKSHPAVAAVVEKVKGEKKPTKKPTRKK